MASPSLCSAPGCENPARQNRYNACSKHEARMRRGGSFEPRQPKQTLSQLLGGRAEIGHWTIIAEGEPYHRKTADGSPHHLGVQRTALCRCDCGVVRNVSIQTLKKGASHHCGCRNGEKNADLHGTHLMSKTSEYRAWAKMKERCRNPNNKDWHNYGGRGIRVCDSWVDDFEVFYADMGPKPSRSHSIDRIDVNGNYEPGNVRWATKSEQMQNVRHNVRVEFEGETLALIQDRRDVGFD